MDAARALALSAALASLALAGCLGAPGPDVVADPAYLARQPGVQPGDVDPCRIRVTTPDGPPVAGARVVLFTERAPTGAEAFEVTGADLPDGPWWPGDGGPFPLLAQARTPANGTVVGLVDPDRVVDGEGPYPIHVAVAGVAGHTDEVRLTSVAAGVPHSPVMLPVDELSCEIEARDVTVYPRHRSLTFDGTMETTVWPAPSDAGPVESPWQPVEIRFHDDVRTAIGYAVRAASLELTLSWTNGADAWGDLHLGVGDEDDASERSDDPFQGPGEGNVTETLAWERDPPAPFELYAGPSTDRAVVGTAAYELGVEATFVGADLDPPGASD